MLNGSCLCGAVGIEVQGGLERGFCSVCGSTLFWKPEIADYEYTSVAMGAFDDATGVRISKHIFVADKGDYYDIEDGVPQSDAY